MLWAIVGATWSPFESREISWKSRGAIWARFGRWHVREWFVTWRMSEVGGEEICGWHGLTWVRISFVISCFSRFFRFFRSYVLHVTQRISHCTDNHKTCGWGDAVAVGVSRMGVWSTWLVSLFTWLGDYDGLWSMWWSIWRSGVWRAWKCSDSDILESLESLELFSTTLAISEDFLVYSGALESFGVIFEISVVVFFKYSGVSEDNFGALWSSLLGL